MVNAKKAARRQSNLIGIILVFSVFAIAYILSNAEKALASAIVFGVFLTIIQTKAETRREQLSDWRFWITVSILAIIHFVVIAIVKFPELRAGLISLPFALVDVFAMWALINWIEKRLSGPRAPDSGNP